MRNVPGSNANCVVSLVLVIALLMDAAMADANANDDITWAVQIREQYVGSRANITYHTANNYDIKLDVYTPLHSDRARPTLVYFHGGGWAGGATKDMLTFRFLPFLQFGWNVINVDYRPSSVSPAPAAVEDCICALGWVGDNAKKYNVDVKQIVIMGASAGGLLALTTGMIPLSSSDLGKPCFRDSQATLPTPAAIVNWFGITDVADLIQGPHERWFAVAWLGNQMNRAAIAEQVSPLSYVRPGLPPIVTIHGDKDAIVPYNHAVRLHDALSKAHVPNSLVTVPGGAHDAFGVAATRDAFRQVFAFLEKAGLTMHPE